MGSYTPPPLGQPPFDPCQYRWCLPGTHSVTVGCRCKAVACERILAVEMERQLVEGVFVGDVAVRNSTSPKQEGWEFTDRDLWSGWGRGAFST